jgi:Endoribonuclease L-PSP
MRGAGLKTMTGQLSRTVIEPTNPRLNVSPNANLPHSPGIRVGEYIFLSGMGPVDPATGGRNLGPIADQIRQTLRNMEHMLASAGSGLDRIVEDQRRPRGYPGLRRDEPRLARILPRRPASPHYLRPSAQQWQRRRNRVHRSQPLRHSLSASFTMRIDFGR